MAGCGFQCAKYTLFVFNALFWLIGAGILAVGIWLAVDPNILEYLNLGDFSGDDQQLKWAAYFLIAAGGAVFILGFCGCCGAIRESQCLLGFYAICILGIIGLEIAAGVYAYLKRDEIIDQIEQELQDAIKEDYDGSNVLSITWHKAMIEFECCGVKGHADWQTVDNWDNTDLTVTGGYRVPKACCVLLENGQDPEDPKPVNDQACQNKQDDAIRNKGCSEAIEEWIESRSLILIGIGFAVAAFELLVLILALCVCCQIRNKD